MLVEMKASFNRRRPSAERMSSCSMCDPTTGTCDPSVTVEEIPRKSLKSCRSMPSMSVCDRNAKDTVLVFSTVDNLESDNVSEL